MWDGRWYAGIALRGYPNWNPVLQQSGYPFFPVLPWLLRHAKGVGVPYIVNGPIISMAAFGFGLWGVYRVVRRHASPDVAALAVWALALSPMSAVFSLAYPSGLMLATTTWAIDFAERRHDLAAGLLAAVACLTRPNGCAVIAALAVLAWHERRRWWMLAGPSVVALAWWMTTLWRWTGDPFIFIAEKQAWREVPLAEVMLFRTTDPSAYTHVALALAAIVAVWIARRRMPGAWVVFLAAYLLPSTVMGVVGVGRSVSECFPPFVAVAMALGGASSPARRAYFSASAALFLLVTFVFAVHRVLP